MELADPDIATTVDLCVKQGATHIIAQPFMLSPGRHSTSDIPNLVQEAAAKHPLVKIEVKPHFGLHYVKSNFDSAGCNNILRDIIFPNSIQSINTNFLTFSICFFLNHIHNNN